MPFEPLDTDEELKGPYPRKTSLEQQLMSGCMVIFVASVITYALAAWPFLIFEIFTISGLSMALALASVPTWAFGIYLVRRFAQAGMTAYVGGVVVGAVFMMLRFGQIVLVMDVSQLPQLEYAPSVKWVAPVTWVLLSVGIGAIFFPDNRKDDKGSD